MNQQQIPGHSFEERLLARLRAEVADRGASDEVIADSATVTSAWRRQAPRLALGAAASAAVAVVVLAISAGGETSPAYAVEAQPEGEVSVEIRSLEDAEGLERALGEAGVAADVSYLAAETECKEPRFVAVPWPDGDRVIVQEPAGGVGPIVFSVSRGAVGAGQTLVITASPGSDGLQSAQVKLAEGAVTPCEPVPAP